MKTENHLISPTCGRMPMPGKLRFMVVIFTIITAMLFTLPSHVAGQIEPVFGYGLGSTGADLGFDITIDTDGNRYVTGQFVGTVDFDPGTGITNLTSAAASDMFVLKLNSLGTLVWAVRFGGSGTDVSTSIAVDHGGNVYFTGYGGSIDFGGGLLTATGVDGYVCKLDPAGAHVWSKALGGTGNQRGRGISVDKTGSFVYLTGEFTTSLSAFGFTAGQQNDAFTAKLNGIDGSNVWARQFQGFIGVTVTGQQYGQGVVVDGENNVITIGRFEGTVNFNPGGVAFPLTSLGSTDIFINKLDNSGLNVWSIQFGNLLADDGYDITVDSAWNVYTTGSFRDVVDFDPGTGTNNLTSAGLQDVFISKLTNAGTFGWAARLGNTGSDIGQGVTYNNIGDEIGVTGLFAGILDCRTVSAGMSDAFLSFFQADGTPVITGGIGGTNAESGNSIATDGITYSATGAFQSLPADLDPAGGQLLVNTMGGNDIYVANYTVQALSVCDLAIVSIIPGKTSGPGISDGTITINATCTSCSALQYSIDNGANFQPGNLFTGLAAGPYQIIVRDAGNICCFQTGTVNILETLAFTVSGYARYYNNPLTFLDGLTITLKQGESVVGTPVVTGTNGYCEFLEVPEGIYSLEIASAAPGGVWQTWNGVNSTDYLLASRHASGISLLKSDPPVVRISADVKSPQTPPVITSLDATAIRNAAKYGWFVPSTTTPWFDISKWVFSGITSSLALTGFEVSGGNLTREIRGLCAGDLNGSYVPALGNKEATPALELINQGMINLDQEVVFPVIAMQDLELGAITLILDYQQEIIEITAVEMPQQGDEPPFFRSEGNTLYIGWASLDPVNIKTNGTLLLIHAKLINDDAEMTHFSLHPSPLNELADGQGNLITDGKLAIVDGKAGAGTFSGKIMIHPNPAGEQLNIEFLAGKEGEITIELVNPQGITVVKQEKISILGGLNRIQLNVGNLSAGMYLLYLHDGDQHKTMKVIKK